MCADPRRYRRLPFFTRLYRELRCFLDGHHDFRKTATHAACAWCGALYFRSEEDEATSDEQESEAEPCRVCGAVGACLDRERVCASCGFNRPPGCFCPTPCPSEFRAGFGRMAVGCPGTVEA